MPPSPTARTEAQDQYALAMRMRPPRPVRARFGARMVFGIFAALFGLLPVGLIGLGGWRMYQNSVLRSRGETVMGRVVEVDPRTGALKYDGGPAGDVRTRRGGNHTTLHYAYEVDLKTYVVTANVSGIALDEAGHETEIVYLPQDPGLAAPRFVLDRSFKDSSSFLFYLVGGGLLLVGIPLGMWELRPYWQRRQLLVHGLPAVGTITAVEPRDKTTFQATYSFAGRGGSHVGTAVVSSSTAELLKKAKQAAVFYDPKDAARTDLYVSMAESFRIVDEPR